jgi:hypothetical protein
LKFPDRTADTTFSNFLLARRAHSSEAPNDDQLGSEGTAPIHLVDVVFLEAVLSFDLDALIGQCRPDDGIHGHRRVASDAIGL